VSARPVPAPVPPRRLWWLLAGFIVWCIALSLLYALHAIGCAFGWPTGSLRLGLFAALLIHVAVLGWMWRHCARTGPEPGSGATGAFFQVVFLWTTAVAFVATVVVLFPPLALSACV
jgi:hypothetical protein